MDIACELVGPTNSYLGPTDLGPESDIYLYISDSGPERGGQCRDSGVAAGAVAACRALWLRRGTDPPEKCSGGFIPVCCNMDSKSDDAKVKMCGRHITNWPLATCQISAQSVQPFSRYRSGVSLARTHVLKHPQKMTHRHELSVECLAVYQVSAQSVQPLCGY